MTLRQQVFALVASVCLLVFIVEMVRRRRLREEYSWLWIVTGVTILVLSSWFGLLEWLTRLIGAVVPASTFFVFGILFLVVINIHFTIKISALTTQVKNQAQRLAILDSYVQEIRVVDKLEGDGTERIDCGPTAPTGSATSVASNGEEVG
jgi:hypothetical protein